MPQKIDKPYSIDMLGGDYWLNTFGRRIPLLYFRVIEINKIDIWLN